MTCGDLRRSGEPTHGLATAHRARHKLALLAASLLLLLLLLLLWPPHLAECRHKDSKVLSQRHGECTDGVQRIIAQLIRGAVYHLGVCSEVGVGVRKQLVNANGCHAVSTTGKAPSHSYSAGMHYSCDRQHMCNGQRNCAQQKEGKQQYAPRRPAAADNCFAIHYPPPPIPPGFLTPLQAHFHEWLQHCAAEARQVYAGQQAPQAAQHTPF
jgi:hypothetical protein